MTSRRPSSGTTAARWQTRSSSLHVTTKGSGGKRTAWRQALAPYAIALNLPSPGVTWMLDTFIRDHVKQTNVAALAPGLGLADGLDALFKELADVEVTLAKSPAPFMWSRRW